MCIIAYAKKGVDIPTETQIRQMWDANPDGAGFAFVNKQKRVEYHKGYMTLEELLTALADREQYKNTEFAIHFRIGTSGKNDEYTTHPFPISTSFGDLRQTDGATDAILFHNGILGSGGLVNPQSSDTQDFVIAIAPLIQKYNKSKARDALIEDIVGTSKVLTMYKGGRVKMYGNWSKDGDLIVSNTYYKYTAHTYGTGHTYSKADAFSYGHSYDYYTSTGTGTGTDTTVDLDDEYEHIQMPEEWWNKWHQDQAIAKASEMFAKIIKNQFAYVTEQELNNLIECADDCEYGLITYAGYEFGYDADQAIVWLESKPEIPELKGANM